KWEAPPVAPKKEQPAAGRTIPDMYHYVLKSMVVIVGISPNGTSLGSGSIVDADERLIVTAYHVVAKAAQLAVFFPTFEGGKLAAQKWPSLSNLQNLNKLPDDLTPAEVIATDATRDLALLRVSKLPPGMAARPVAKEAVKIGETVHSVVPGPGATWVHAQGNVRAVFRRKWMMGGLPLEAEVIETQFLNKVEGGAALVNDRGELMGVNDGRLPAGLLSTFISSNEARDFVEREYQRKYGMPWRPASRAASLQ